MNNTEVASCDVIPTSTTTNNTKVASSDVIPTTTPTNNTEVASCDVIPTTTTTNNTEVASCDVIPTTTTMNNTDVASCDVIPTTTPTNNSGGDCARTKVFSIDPTKRMLRQSKQQKKDEDEIFSPLFEPTGEKLGRGSFGSVSTYRNKETGKEFAVKVIRNCWDKNRVINRRVVNEIKTCQRYKNSENILTFVEFYWIGDTFFLMFEKMAGGDLRALLTSTPYLSESQVSRVTNAIARALLTLHKDGVAHRDLKPKNILCHSPGQVTPLVLCDFGVASESPSRRHPPKGDITKPALKSSVGCPQYMAPEIAGLRLPEPQRSKAPYDTRCDMWSLGILIFEMLFRRLPFVGHCAQHVQVSVRGCRGCNEDMFPKICSGEFSIPRHTRESLSYYAGDLIRRLLVVDSRNRYSAAEVLKHPFVTAHRNDDVTTTTDCRTVLP
ncbi:MAP kinase-interacting serine/threonine-protein kinase 1-like [Aplysia californica]|uniref:MAP kinase-interacting serine/threonine-protein kinase 1-like n=1 Tax=Aplysia californica TaxID=6500 RepID=A0ABM1A5W1_APLCA|nr:MAP kinase-interacting serine/threonine-protein kinase 1-like [Aplysia californica]